MMIETLDALITNTGQPSLLGMPTRDDDFEPTSYEDPRFPISRIFESSELGSLTYTGRAINQNTALGLSTVLACTRVLSNALAMSQLLVMRRVSDSQTEQATTNYLYPMLRDAVGPNMTAFRFIRLMMTWVVLRGNAIATYDELLNGRVTNIQPVENDRVEYVPQSDGSLKYEIWPRDRKGKPKILTSRNVLHFRGLESTDDGIGLSPITIARQALALGLATEEYAAKLFGNGALMQGYLKYPGRLGAEGKANLKKSFKLQAGDGLRNAHNVPILEEGTEFVKISIDPVDVQFLASRQWTVKEICRWLGVQPHMVGDLDGAIRANIEQENIGFVLHSLGPYKTNFEQELSLTFLSASERKQFFFYFNCDALERADKKTRFESWAIARQNGWMNANQINAAEGQNSVPDGDVFLVNGTMIPLDVAKNKSLTDVAPDAITTEEDSNDEA